MQDNVLELDSNIEYLELSYNLTLHKQFFKQIILHKDFKGNIVKEKLTSRSLDLNTASLDEDYIDHTFYPYIDKSLSSIIIDEANPYFKATNNMLYSKDGRKLFISAPCNEIEHIVIDDNCNYLALNSLSISKHTKSITFPKSYKELNSLFQFLFLNLDEKLIHEVKIYLPSVSAFSMKKMRRPPFEDVLFLHSKSLLDQFIFIAPSLAISSVESDLEYKLNICMGFLLNIELFDESKIKDYSNFIVNNLYHVQNRVKSILDFDEQKKAFTTLTSLVQKANLNFYEQDYLNRCALVETYLLSFNLDAIKALKLEQFKDNINKVLPSFYLLSIALKFNSKECVEYLCSLNMSFDIEYIISSKSTMVFENLIDFKENELDYEFYVDNFKFTYFYRIFDYRRRIYISSYYLSLVCNSLDNYVLTIKRDFTYKGSHIYESKLFLETLSERDILENFKVLMERQNLNKDDLSDLYFYALVYKKEILAQYLEECGISIAEDYINELTMHYKSFYMQNLLDKMKKRDLRGIYLIVKSLVKDRHYLCLDEKFFLDLTFKDEDYENLTYILTNSYIVFNNNLGFLVNLMQRDDSALFFCFINAYQYENNDNLDFLIKYSLNLNKAELTAFLLDHKHNSSIESNEDLVL